MWLLASTTAIMIMAITSFITAKAIREIMRYGITLTQGLNFIDVTKVTLTTITLARSTAKIIKNISVIKDCIMIPIIGINTVLTVWGMTVTTGIETETVTNVTMTGTIAGNSLEQVAKIRLAR